MNTFLKLDCRSETAVSWNELNKTIFVILAVTLAFLLSLTVFAYAQESSMDQPHDVQGCLSCHFMSAFDEPNMIPGGSDGVYVNVCISFRNKKITRPPVHLKT